MDPLTHAMVGLGVGALSGQPLSPYNPIYCAAVMGAVTPDLDVITMLKGELFLIKHHRGASHSLGGLILLSATIAGIIYLDFGLYPWPYFFWAFGGALSHGVLDFFNSYGTQIWWPFCKKRRSGNLLMFFDPIFILFFLPIFFAAQDPLKTAIIAFSGIILYLFLRWSMRRQAERLLIKEYGAKMEKESRLAVLPALKGFVHYDFLIERPREVMIGTLNFLERKVSNCRYMDKIASSPLIFKALQTAPGRLFCQFTSYYFITQWEEKGKYFVKLADLRFKRQTDDFLYKLTLIFDEQHLLEEAYFSHQNNLTPIDLT